LKDGEKGLEEKLPILTLSDGRVLWLDGDKISGEDALTIAKSLFDAFGGHGPRITRHLMYDVEPAIFAECNHTESFERAVEISKREDDMEKLEKRLEK